jgi:anti-sigma factor RsiW
MTTTGEAHPSTFALDVFFAQGQGQAGVVESHLEACPRCRAYVDELEATKDNAPARFMTTTPRATTPGSPTPSGVPKGLRRGKPIRWTSSRLWRTSALGVLAAAAGAVLLVKMLEPKPEPVAYVGAKGTPIVAALIHRDRTSLWDGHSPIQSGDAIAFRVVCEGFTEVTVATPAAGDGTSWTRAFDGACPAGEEPLQFTLVADDAPGDERVAIVLRRRKVDDRELESAIRNATRTTSVFTFELRFPKGGGAR